LIRLVPPVAVTTVTSVFPAGSADVTALIDVALFTVRLAALMRPNLTAVVPVKFVPVILVVVPPPTGPLLGDTPVTVGTSVYVKRSLELVGLVPLGVVTVTSTGPVPAGETAVIDVSDATVKLEAGIEPNLTFVASLRFVPVIATVLPPARGPALGFTSVIAGA